MNTAVKIGTALVAVALLSVAVAAFVHLGVVPLALAGLTHMLGIGVLGVLALVLAR